MFKIFGNKQDIKSGPIAKQRELEKLKAKEDKASQKPQEKQEIKRVYGGAQALASLGQISRGNAPKELGTAFGIDIPMSELTKIYNNSQEIVALKDKLYDTSLQMQDVALKKIATLEARFKKYADGASKSGNIQIKPANDGKNFVMEEKNSDGKTIMVSSHKPDGTLIKFIETNGNKQNWFMNADDGVFVYRENCSPSKDGTIRSERELIIDADSNYTYEEGVVQTPDYNRQSDLKYTCEKDGKMAELTVVERNNSRSLNKITKKTIKPLGDSDLSHSYMETTIFPELSKIQSDKVFTLVGGKTPVHFLDSVLQDGTRTVKGYKLQNGIWYKEDEVKI